MKWKRSYWRAIVLRVQRSSFIPQRVRRGMLNAIGARIHPTATINHSCWLASADIVMGPDAFINSFAFYDGKGRLTLEQGVRIAVYAAFITESHAIGGPDRRASLEDTVSPITIGKGTWIGARSTILPGCNVAPGCVFGAGSVIVGPSEPNGLYLNALSPTGIINAQRRDTLSCGDAA